MTEDTAYVIAKQTASGYIYRSRSNGWTDRPRSAHLYHSPKRASNALKAMNMEDPYYEILSIHLILDW